MTCHTCVANSLVGDMIRALAPDEALWTRSRSNKGSKNAAVLPLPVLAIATTSFFSNINGIAWNKLHKILLVLYEWLLCIFPFNIIMYYIIIYNMLLQLICIKMTIITTFIPNHRNKNENDSHGKN